MPKFTERRTKQEVVIESVLLFIPSQNKIPKISFEDQVLIGILS